MTGTMKSAIVLGVGVVLFAIVDVFASLLSWHGAPTDTTWKPDFFVYEASRLSCWLILAFIAAVFSFAASYMLSRYPHSLQDHFPGATMIATVLFCILTLGTEYATSIRFWRSVPQNDAVALGFSERAYAREHLEAWSLVITVVVLGAGLYYSNFRRTRHRSVGQ